MQKVGELEYGNTNVMASALHLRQIFLNIYGNCIKFTNRGGSITTSHQCLEKKGNIITFCWTITDTGIGMSKEFLSHIFEPFSQENQGARSQYAGCGLGMAIVKKLIDEMDGNISIDSEIGKGSRFVITLPFEMTSAEVEKEQNQDLTKKLYGVKILLAEDNALNVEVASSMLEDLGANVTAVDNGKKALEEFKNQPAGSFNAILMDLMMPQMDGYAATRAIRGINREDAKEIPIIAVTANAFFEDRQKALDAGMNDHISKPIDVNKMVEVILKHLV